MTMLIVIIKPQTGNVAGVWITSCPEEMGWEFRDFEKEAFEGWHWTMQADSWVSAIKLRVEDLDVFFSRSLPTEILDITRFTALGMVSIVWLRKTFMNWFLSPRVEEPNSEVNKTVRTWSTESACVLVLCGLHMYTYGYTTDVPLNTNKQATSCSKRNVWVYAYSYKVM